MSSSTKSSDFDQGEQRVASRRSFAAHETEEKTHARHATMVKKAIKGKKVDLSNLVANNKSHIPDRPVERAEGESGFFRRDYHDRDRPTFRSEVRRAKASACKREG